MKLIKKLKNQSGFGYVELLVSLMIIVILLIGIYSLINLYVMINGENSNYVQAVEIGNQKMERIRNLPYDQVGTIAGSPSGSLPQTETIIKEGTFTVNTLIKYFQDPYDGLVPPADPIFDDYKIATIEVLWNGKYGARKISVFSKIIPRTMETSSGNGLLVLHVVDANGNPVSGATVHIENTLAGADYVSTDQVSDVDGIVMYSAKPSFEDYRITVTKAGYSTEQTYSRTATNPNPTRPHLTLTLGNKTEESFSIDIMSQLDINTISQILPSNWKAYNDASGKPQVNSRIAFDNLGNAYVVWQDYGFSADSKIYAQKYDEDGNALWGAIVKVGSANNTMLPDIKVSSANNLYLAWSDDSVGNKESYLHSLKSDGTDNWGGEKKINTGWNSNITNANIALLNKSGYATTSVVWVDDWNGDYDIFINYYDDIGNPAAVPGFDAAETVNNTPQSDGSTQIEPAIVSSPDDEVYVAWTDNRNGDNDIYCAKFDDEGNFLWAAENIKINTDGGASQQYESDIAMDSSGNIYVVWTDERNTDKDIYAQKYDPNGNVLWAGSDIKISTSINTADQSEPSIAIDSADNIYISWTDEKNGNKDIYAQKYDVNGIALWSDDLRVNINTDNSNQYNSELTINPITQKPFATWTDDRGGDPDVFISEFDVYGGPSIYPDIDLRVVGTKRIGENPIIYKYNVPLTTDANGVAQLAVEWDSQGYTITATTTGPAIELSEPTMPIPVLPGATSNVKLYMD